MRLPDYTEKIIETLENAGFEAFAVGGCVRDMLMNRMPSDWDITTSAEPEAVMHVFSEFHTVPTGIKHGTVTVFCGGVPLEITTYRIDGKYTDSRHPSFVRFTEKLGEDLRRRDFTVNAMAYNPHRGLIDLFGGREDIEKRVIRCVGAPCERFREDALRIMRALRFSAVLGFEISDETATAAVECRSLLANVSAERISSELNKTLTAPDPYSVLMRFGAVFAEVIPEILPVLGNGGGAWENTVLAVREAAPELCVRLAVLFSGISGSSTADGDTVFPVSDTARNGSAAAVSALGRLKYDNETKRTVRTLTELCGTEIPADKVSVKRVLKRMGSEIFRLLLEVKKAEASRAEVPGDAYACTLQLEKIFSEIMAAGECFSLDTLAVSGSDLIEHGIEPGRKIGLTLERLLDLVIEGKCKNEKEALLGAV